MNPNKKTAPIALFVYNRIEHLQKTIESLKQNQLAKESELYIYSDGAKNIEDENKVSMIRKYLKMIDGFKSIIITERPKNIGLAQSIISGVTEIIEKFGKVIVLEDDLFLSPHFLQFMNDALDLYEKDDSVMSASGYLFPLNPKYKITETFFLSFIATWGWATWERAWKKFNPDPKMLLDQIKKRNLEYHFNIDGGHSFLHHLKANIIGRWDTWGIKWYASVFLFGGLTLFPSKSLVRHVGYGENATHAKNTDELIVKISDKPITVNKIIIKESIVARRALKNYYLSLEKNPTEKYFKLFKENLKRIVPIKWVFDFLRTHLYNERNAI